MAKKTNYEILDEILRDLPPMRDEHNQKEIDAETARRLREAVEQRKTVDDIEKYLRG